MVSNNRDASERARWCHTSQTLEGVPVHAPRWCMRLPDRGLTILAVRRRPRVGAVEDCLLQGGVRSRPRSATADGSRRRVATRYPPSVREQSPRPRGTSDPASATRAIGGRDPHHWQRRCSRDSACSRAVSPGHPVSVIGARRSWPPIMLELPQFCGTSRTTAGRPHGTAPASFVNCGRPATATL